MHDMQNRSLRGRCHPLLQTMMSWQSTLVRRTGEVGVSCAALDEGAVLQEWKLVCSSKETAALACLE